MVSIEFNKDIFPNSDISFFFQGLRTSRRWTRSRTLWPRSWLRHRDCRRRGRSGYRTTTPIVCRNDPDPYFRRGPGSLWAYCGHLPIHEIRRISPNVTSSILEKKTISSFSAKS